MSKSNPVSPKVIAAAVGAGVGGGAGAVVSTLVLWIVGVLAYGVPGDADNAAAAAAAVPLPLSGAILLVLAIGGAALVAARAGYSTTDPLRVTADNVPAGYVDPTVDGDGNAPGALTA